MNLEDGDVCVKEIHSTIERCLAGLNRRIPPAYRGPCPALVTAGLKGKKVACDTPLYAHRSDDNGTVKTADVTICPRCRTEHDTRHLEQRLLSDVEKYLMPADQILQVMKELGEPVAKSTWHNWRANGKIQPHAWRRNGRIVNYLITEDDEKLYRLDAVRRYSATASRRRQGHPWREATRADGLTHRADWRKRHASARATSPILLECRRCEGRQPKRQSPRPGSRKQ